MSSFLTMSFIFTIENYPLYASNNYICYFFVVLDLSVNFVIIYVIIQYYKVTFP